MIARILTTWLLCQESHAFSPHAHRGGLNGPANQIQWGLHAGESISVNEPSSTPLDEEPATSSDIIPTEEMPTMSAPLSSLDDIGKTSILPLNDGIPSSAQEAQEDTATSYNQDAEITLSSNGNTANIGEEIFAKEKRVHVSIRYTSIPGLRPYYLTIAKKIKSSNPDVIVEKVLLPHGEDDVLEDTIFEVMVDGKVVIGKPRSKFQNVRRSGNDEVNNNKVYGMSVYISMEDLNVAIGKARKKRRPSTSYTPEDRGKAIRLEMLMKQKKA